MAIIFVDKSDHALTTVWRQDYANNKQVTVAITVGLREALARYCDVH